MELPHGQRPALKTHAAASHLTSPCLSGSPVHAPAIIRRPHHAVSTARMSSPHARTLSGVEPVQLRGNRRHARERRRVWTVSTARMSSPKLPVAMVVLEPRATAHNTRWPRYLIGVEIGCLDSVPANTQQTKKGP